MSTGDESLLNRASPGYRQARLRELHPQRDSADTSPVCFHSLAYSVRRVRGSDERVLRFTVHGGFLVDIALPNSLAAELAKSLLGGAP
jgi:hypothetical protein